VKPVIPNINKKLGSLLIMEYTGKSSNAKFLPPYLIDSREK
jgi:hypothetical protein